MSILLRITRGPGKEISSDPVLRIYGALLAFLLVLAGINWLLMGVEPALAADHEAICWPMWPTCETARILSAQHLHVCLIVFTAASGATAVLFLMRRFCGLACASLFLLNVMKIAFIALDYRMRLNQHIMAFWVTAVFLFLPRKRQSLMLMIVLFYVWAGLLKITPEWLSGAALYEKPWLIGPKLLPYACGYVVVLEVFLAWCLLGRSSVWRWAVFGQFCLFHFFSWSVVGFFYPLLMYSILAIFPLCWLQQSDEHRHSNLTSLRQSNPMWPGYAAALVFSCSQLLPHFMPGDTALTGEGRLFALHMFDAKPDCEAFATIIDDLGRRKRVDLLIAGPARIHCDPAVYISRARHLCATRASPSSARKIHMDLNVRSKRATQPILHDIVDLEDFCQHSVTYKVFSHNDWINGLQI